MGLARHGRAPLLVRRRASAYTSVFACAVLFVVWAGVAAVGGQPGEALERGPPTEATGRPAAGLPDHVPEGRRLAGYPDDPLIDRPYGKARNRWLIIVHIILIGYMLLGLNTVCDVYFTGSLQVMVDKWGVKPDVAGATFMAAGGSAPELFTSLIGAFIENDVGFGTIVGSAVFNVLFVIGICGFASSGSIQLNWWPLFRDCSYYIFGLGILAYFSSDEAIKLHEAIVLFLAYLIYVVIMFNNTRLELLTDTEFRRAKQAAVVPASPMKFSPVHPDVSPPEVQQDVVEKMVPSAWEAPDSVETAESIKSDAIGDPGAMGIASSCETSARSCSCGAGLVGPPRVSSKELPWRSDRTSSRTSLVCSHCMLSAKVRIACMQGQGFAQRHESRMASLGSPKTEASDQTYFSSEGSRQLPYGTTHPDAPADEAPQATPQHPGTTDTEEAVAEASGLPPGAQAVDNGSGLEQVDQQTAEAERPEGMEDEEDEEDDEGDLMRKPEGGWSLVLWYFSLPIYVPLYYLTPMPSERWFLLTFALSLLWIAGFSFFMVWWVEVLGEVFHIDTIIMGFTLLAAGTSIPDAVSSLAVTRNGEGDMAVSSSVGSNIFDILVGLPIPWILKIGIIDGGKSEVKIISPYLTFYVLLLLSMVFAVIVCIHMLSWKLNKVLGLLMALLYIIFLTVAITVEKVAPEWLKF